MVGRFTPAAIICKIYCKVKDGMPNNLSRRELLGILSAGACTPFPGYSFLCPHQTRSLLRRHGPRLRLPLPLGTTNFLTISRRLIFNISGNKPAPKPA